MSSTTVGFGQPPVRCCGSRRGPAFRERGWLERKRETQRTQKGTQTDGPKLTGVSAADLARIRNANLGRFTIDRLMTILSGPGQDVNVSIDVHPRRSAASVKARV
ncbi:MAG TPA: XRE family transcriptional regulator [Acetobacteraceae bacterium]